MSFKDFVKIFSLAKDKATQSFTKDERLGFAFTFAGFKEIYWLPFTFWLRLWLLKYVTKYIPFVLIDTWIDDNNFLGNTTLYFI